MYNMQFSNKYSFFLFAMCVLVQALEEIDRESSNYKTEKFYLSLDRANFFEAFINCKEGGMELASIDNEEESAALDSFLDPYKIDGAGANGFWLAGTNLINTSISQYYWLSTGVRTIFTNWYPGQPDNGGNQEHCLQWIYISSTAITTGWNDWNCNGTSRYVCEYVSN